MTTLIRRDKRGRFARSRRLLFIFIIASILVAGLVIAFNPYALTYISNATEDLDEIIIKQDSFDKFGKELSDSARAMYEAKQTVIRAQDALYEAELLLASTTEDYNDAISAFELYQDVK